MFLSVVLWQQFHTPLWIHCRNGFMGIVFHDCLVQLLVRLGSCSNSGPGYGTENRTQETGPPNESESGEARFFYESNIVGKCQNDVKRIDQS